MHTLIKNKKKRELPDIQKTHGRKCECGQEGGFVVERIKPIGFKPYRKITRFPAWGFEMGDGRISIGFPGGRFCQDCVKDELKRLEKLYPI